MLGSTASSTARSTASKCYQYFHVILLHLQGCKFLKNDLTAAAAGIEPLTTDEKSSATTQGP